jgi:hypothetical protein
MLKKQSSRSHHFVFSMSGYCMNERCDSSLIFFPPLKTLYKVGTRRQSAKPFLQSSELGPPPFWFRGGGAHSLAREGMRESQLRRGAYTVVLYNLQYMYIVTVAHYKCRKVRSWKAPVYQPHAPQPWYRTRWFLPLSEHR